MKDIYTDDTVIACQLIAFAYPSCKCDLVFLILGKQIGPASAQAKYYARHSAAENAGTYPTY